MREYDCVKVIELLQSNRPYQGAASVMRPLSVGDIGAVVYVYSVQSEAVGYIVESVNEEGNTVWLADFLPDEIAPVS